LPGSEASVIPRRHGVSEARLRRAVKVQLPSTIADVGNLLGDVRALLLIEATAAQDLSEFINLVETNYQPINCSLCRSR